MTSMIQNDTNDNEYAAADNDEYDATCSLSSAAADDDEYDDDDDVDADDDDDNRSFISIFPPTGMNWSWALNWDMATLGRSVQIL